MIGPLLSVYPSRNGPTGGDIDPEASSRPSATNSAPCRRSIRTMVGAADPGVRSGSMVTGAAIITTGEPTRTAQSLATALAQLRFDGMTSTAVTRLVTRVVEDWAEGLGWLAVAEMPFDFIADTPERPGRQGYIDLYIARTGYKRDLAIEIDRANKVWSAQKLGHAVEHGKAAIWVRWKGLAPSPEIVPQGVEVVHLGPGAAPEAVAAEPPAGQAEGSPPGLSAASRALLASLYPAGVPAEDPVWGDEDAIWERVDALRPRLALVIRCRFGRHAARSLTLARTADVVAQELNVPVVSRERIRQLQDSAMRRLRARSAAQVRKARRGVVDQVPMRPQPDPESSAAPSDNRPRERRATRSGVMPGQEELLVLVEDVLRSFNGELPVGLLAHVLLGSHGPKTRELVKAHALPHHGAVADVEFMEVRRAILALADDGRLASRREEESSEYPRTYVRLIDTRREPADEPRP